jgi:hypothetical protein
MSFSQSYQNISTDYYRAYTMDKGDDNLRSRILREAAEHQAPRRRSGWTKRPKYDGQATFNSKDGMQQVPFAKSHIADQATWTTPAPLPEDFNQAKQWASGPSDSDPILHELDEIQREASLLGDGRCKDEASASDQERTERQKETCRPSNNVQSIGDLEGWTFLQQQRTPRSSSEPAPYNPHDDYLEPTGKILLQPETRPITQEQLVNEVKGIYAGLVMVEKKCVEIDQQQSKTTNKLSDEQWQGLITLHRTLLYEHHDFFLASQHPAASPALQRLAMKYAMPRRMLRHGIHSFLELLLPRWPNNFDDMIAFIDLARSMVSLMEDILPESEEQWEDCRRCLESYTEVLLRVSLATTNGSEDSPWDRSSGGRTAQSSPSSWSSIPTPWSPSLSLFPRYDMSTAAAEQEEEFGDWYFQCYPPPEPLSPAEIEQSYNKLPQLTDAVLCVLSGWLQYGQVIATNFNIYSKVFCMLLLSAVG